MSPVSRCSSTADSRRSNFLAPRSTRRCSGTKIACLPMPEDSFAVSYQRPPGTDRQHMMCPGSGIHPAIHGKVRPGNVRGLRAGDESDHCGDLLDAPVAAEYRGGFLRHGPIA